LVCAMLLRSARCDSSIFASVSCVLSVPTTPPFETLAGGRYYACRRQRLRRPNDGSLHLGDPAATGGGRILPASRSASGL
jgi:hypothetical protein